MIYRNRRTGVTVEVFSELRGEWERVDKPSPVSVTEEKTEKKTPARKTVKKKVSK